MGNFIWALRPGRLLAGEESTSRRRVLCLRRTVRCSIASKAIPPSMLCLAPRFFEEWSVRLAGWIAAGTNCFFMVHCPNDAYSPPLARQCNALMVARMGAATLPAWPVPQLALDW